MKGSSILNFKRWPKIHHPLPQTPRESQQLLSALTSSFRRQLEAADTNKPAEFADQHLQAILKNPLFSVVPPKSSYPALDPNSRATQERIEKNPMAEFDGLAAAGTLTGKQISLCLNAQLALIGAQSTDVQRDMKSTGAGRRVVEWFWASGSDPRKSLFKSSRATRAALKFMVAEGLYDHINALILALGRFDVGGDNGKIPEDVGMRVFAKFLHDYLAAEVYYGRGLASALAIFVQAADSISSKPMDTRKDMLENATKYLVHFRSRHQRDKRFKEIPIPTFEEYCKSLDAISGLMLWRHAMQLYHPKRPDGRPLLKHVQSHLEYTTSSWSEADQDLVVAIYLDAMRLLIDQERYKDALQLSPYIKHMLSEERHENHQVHDYTPQLDELMGRLSLALG